MDFTTGFAHGFCTWILHIDFSYGFFTWMVRTVFSDCLFIWIFHIDFSAANLNPYTIWCLAAAGQIGFDGGSARSTRRHCYPSFTRARSDQIARQYIYIYIYITQEKNK